MDYLKIARDVLSIEAKALLSASERLEADEMNRFIEIIEFLRSVGGNLVFCGVGKSGHIATKLAATFTSLGLPSFFLHPVEALHGDLGRVTKSDAVVFLSKSGTTSEILKLMPFLPVESSMRIGILGAKDSPIGKACGLVLDCTVEQEACINDQAPTTSSTLALAMGDALAVVYESFVDLSKEGFAVNHPGGLLGKSMRIKVSHLMWTKAECPTVKATSTLKEVLLEMTRVPVGGCAVTDEAGKLLGILVEGDIRRSFTRDDISLESKITEVMTEGPISIGPDELAYDALKLMENREREIDILPVISEENDFLGFIRLHDLLKEGFLSSKK